MHITACTLQHTTQSSEDNLPMQFTKSKMKSVINNQFNFSALPL